jgi:hypothetical protein
LGAQHQISQRQRANPHPTPLQQLATGEGQVVELKGMVHDLCPQLEVIG